MIQKEVIQEGMLIPIQDSVNDIVQNCDASGLKVELASLAEHVNNLLE